MFLDPTASHLIICTTGGDNYYLHSQSKTPKLLGRLHKVSVESVAWNPSIPTSSTREILLGAADGTIYEAYLESAGRRDVRHLRTLAKLPDGPVAGLWADDLEGGHADARRVMVATASRLLHYVGTLGAPGHDGSVYARLFEHERPTVHELPRVATAAAAAAALVVSPNPPDADPHDRRHGSPPPPERVFAWLSSQGVFHGRLLAAPADEDLGRHVFNEARLLPRAQVVSGGGGGHDGDGGGGGGTSDGRRAAADAIDAVALTQWHIVHLVGGHVVVTNRLTGAVVYDQSVLGPGERPLGFSVDIEKNTFWLFTTHEIFEIIVRDEDRNIWQILLDRQQFDAALEHAHTQAQREAVATAHGDHLAARGQHLDAAAVYGRSDKPFEDVVLAFVDCGQPDALRRFLLVKLATTKKAAVMQRVMMASWLVEIFMAKLNAIEDAMMQAAEGGGGSSVAANTLSAAATTTSAPSSPSLAAVRAEFHDFVARFRYDLDKATVYDIISSHGREEELLHFATVVDDDNYVLAYWVRRERWPRVLDVLRRQTDPDLFYRYSSVLMAHAAPELVELLMRHSDLEPRRLIPALLEHNRILHDARARDGKARDGKSTDGRSVDGRSVDTTSPPTPNQAIRYLSHVVHKLGSRDAAVHNTLVSLHAAGPARDEAALLGYLESQGDDPRYDPDFALRLCIQHHRTLACVHIYTSMGQYAQAVDLALSHGELDLAAAVADRPTANPPLRKKLWLSVARKVISQTDGIKAAIDFLARCDLLRIEDLIPFFPDFVVIDDFRDEICAALEGYGRSIDLLKKEMDESSQTAANIKTDIAALHQRYAIVEPGEKCYACALPLLSRQFFVFPCQHSFHSDCLARSVLEHVGPGTARRIRDLQAAISKGIGGASGPRRDAMIEELDSLVASAW
jgi:hypothetical protein